jgi:septum formation protein
MSANGQTMMGTAADTTLILASSSPRRRKLLAETRRTFTVVDSPYDEPQDKPVGVNAASWAESLAYFKARSVAVQHAECWVLGADTVVECAGRILEKPCSVDDARDMLLAQAGRDSAVITGVALVRLQGGGERRMLTHERTVVHMRNDRAFIESYLASGDWAGKAGAYGIQTTGDRLVERIEGSFSNVVGLPLELLGRLFDQLGI